VVEKADNIDVDDDEDSDELEKDLVKMMIREPEEKWDCESILSTHSTLYNHPTLIQELKKVSSKSSVRES
jgi:protein LTV1